MKIPLSLSYLYAIVLDAIRNGKTPDEVSQHLVQRGWPAQAAKRFVENACTREANRSNRLHLIERPEDRIAETMHQRRRSGILWMIAGVVLTWLAHYLSDGSLLTLAPACIAALGLLEWILASRSRH